MKPETIFSNYANRGMTLQLAEVAVPADFKALRKIEKEFATCFENWATETKALEGCPIEITHTTIRADTIKRDDGTRPKVVHITFKPADEEGNRQYTDRIPIASVGEQFQCHMPNYLRAKARYEKGIDIEGERVYREIQGDVVWYVAQDKPSPPKYEGATLAIKQASENWETEIASIIELLQLRLCITTGINSTDSMIYLSAPAQQLDDSDSLIPPELENPQWYSLHGRKGRLYKGPGWNAWQWENHAGDPWAKHFELADA